MKQNTKQKILQTALTLFNTNGLSKVTLRTIANHMQISQGNLNYHFKKREQLIEILYYQLVTNIDKRMMTLSTKDINLKTMYNICSVILKEFYNYRFILLDFTQLMRSQPLIKSHYKKLSLERKSQIIPLFLGLIEKKIIRPEKFDFEYENLYLRIQIIADFWMSSLSVQDAPIDRKITKKYVLIIFENIYPYLTEKGIEEYNKLV